MISSKRYAKLRTDLREESSIGKSRKKSQAFLREMHREFKSMEGCNTDVSCLRLLFEASLKLASEAQLARMMEGVNVILSLQFPTENRINSYSKSVSDYRKLIKKEFSQDVLTRNYNRLLFAGGKGQVGNDQSVEEISDFKTAAREAKIGRAELASKALTQRLSNKIPIDEDEILNALWKVADQKTTADSFIFAQLMMGSRKSEILFESVADYDSEKIETTRPNYIVQYGVAKERRANAEQFDPKDPEEEEQVQEDYKGPPGPHRRRVIKPILRLAKFKGNNQSRQQYTVQDVRNAIIQR